MTALAQSIRDRLAAYGPHTAEALASDYRITVTEARSALRKAGAVPRRFGDVALPAKHRFILYGLGWRTDRSLSRAEAAARMTTPYREEAAS